MAEGGALKLAARWLCKYGSDHGLHSQAKLSKRNIVNVTWWLVLTTCFTICSYCSSSLIARTPRVSHFNTTFQGQKRLAPLTPCL